MWNPFDDGQTIGTLGSESGAIVRDEEHSGGARITIERDCPSAPFTITCGIYGYMVHTRFFGDEAETTRAYEDMKRALDTIVQSIPRNDDPDGDSKMSAVSEKIVAFCEQYP